MRRIAVTCAILAVLALGACSTAPLRPDQATAVPEHRIERPGLVAVVGQAGTAGLARIRFTRDDGALMVGGGCGYNLHIDHRPLATLRNGETLVVQVAPGQYAAHFNLTAVLCPAFSSSTVSVAARPGAEVRLRLGLRDGQPFMQIEDTVQIGGGQ